MIAPVAGSGSCPAWIARVSKSSSLKSTAPRMLETRPEPAGEARERPVEGRRLDALLPPHALNVQLSRLAVVDGLDAPDHTVAAQDREHVVAVLALRLRNVHLEAVAKVPELLGPVAVVDELVERREERHATSHRAVFGVGMRIEPAAPQLDAACPEQLVVDQALCLAPRDALRLRVPPVREIPEPLLAAPSDDGDVAACVQEAEHQAHLPRAPPAVLLARVLDVVLDL